MQQDKVHSLNSSRGHMITQYTPLASKYDKYVKYDKYDKNNKYVI